MFNAPLFGFQEGPPDGVRFFRGIPPGPLMGMALAIVLLALLLWGIKQPLAWVVISFLAIACGVGCAGYGVAQALLVSGPRSSQEVVWVSSFIGGGVGATTGGIVLLVVALLRRRKATGPNA